MEFSVEHLAQDGFTLHLPLIDLNRTLELVEIDFRAEVFQFSTIFSGRVSNSAFPAEVPQTLRPGVTSPTDEGSGSLRVELDRVRQDTILDLHLSAPLLTPNGDGANDTVRFDFNLVNIAGGNLRLEVYDLSGQRRRAIFQGLGYSGLTSISWDGTDQSNTRLPPGMYMVHLEISTDSGSSSVRRLLSIAY